MRKGTLPLGMLLAAFAGSIFAPGAPRTPGTTAAAQQTPAAASADPAPGTAVASPQRAAAALLDRLIGSSGYRPFKYPRRDGWTDRRYRRAARKRANQIRNREAHRG